MTTGEPEYTGLVLEAVREAIRARINTLLHDGRFPQSSAGRARVLTYRDTLQLIDVFERKARNGQLTKEDHA